MKIEEVPAEDEEEEAGTTASKEKLNSKRRNELKRIEERFKKNQ
jgi:hypothetical protein